MEALLQKDYKDARMLLFYLIFPLLFQVFYLMFTVNYPNITYYFMINVLFTLIYTFIFIYYFKEPRYLLIHLVLMIVLQNLLIGVGNTFSNLQSSGENLKLILVYKEVLAVTIVSALFLRFVGNIKLYKFEKMIPLILILIAISFVISDATLDAKAYYSRTFLIIFVSYAIGRLIYFGFHNKEKEIDRFLSFITQLGVVVAIIGFLFMLIDNESYIWNDWFNIGLILEAKRGVYSEYPIWQTQLGNLVLPRMFSIFFDAISLGYFFATTLICSWLRQGKNPLVQYILMIALLCTLVKGAIGIILITSAWMLALRYFKIKPRVFIMSFIFCSIIAFVYLSQSSFKSSHDVHFAGLIEPIVNSIYLPLGTGLGNGGNYYAMAVNMPAWELSYTGTESLFGVLTYQFGYLGLVLYLAFFIGLISILMKFSIHYKDNKLLLLSGVASSIFLASLLQESTLGINYTGILVIIIGFYISKIQHEIHKEKSAL